MCLCHTVHPPQLVVSSYLGRTWAEAPYASEGWDLILKGRVRVGAILGSAGSQVQCNTTLVFKVLAEGRPRAEVPVTMHTRRQAPCCMTHIVLSHLLLVRLTVSALGGSVVYVVCFWATCERRALSVPKDNPQCWQI